MRPKGRRNLHSWTKQIPTKGSKTLEKEYVYTWTTTTKKNDEWRIPLWTDAMRDQMLPIPLPSWSQTQAPKFSVSDRHSHCPNGFHYICVSCVSRNLNVIKNAKKKCSQMCRCPLESKWTRFFSQVTIYLTGNSASHEISLTMHTADQNVLFT